ncbi:MAG: ABC transporter permease [Bacteroidetes bacterium]|nr:MAG: ABC transporter permease [Bacteroidota bacterium]
MSNIWIIAKRELQTFFDSLIGYILLVAFLGITGFLTWILGTDIFLIGQATLEPFFQWAYWTLFFFIPALTMRMIAEERKAGTLESLLTRAVSDWQVIVGKYLACLLLIALALAFTLPFYLVVSWLGPVDHGAVWCGYLGLLLLSSAYISIGLFASSLTNNQIVAFLLALLIGLFFQLLFDIMAGSSTGGIAALIHYLSFTAHFESISRGVVDSRDVIFFVSFTLLGLILAEMQLLKRNIVG